MRIDRIILRNAVADDAEALSGFAARCFQQTFAAGNKPADMEDYLAKAFSPATQSSEIADSAATIILAFDDRAADGQLVGYAHLICHEADVQLKRFYLVASWQGSGLAALFIERIFEECRQRGSGRLWLTVWTENDRAIAFYKKMGFRICGSETFMLGDDAQSDHVMEIAVSRSPPPTSTGAEP